MKQINKNYNFTILEHFVILAFWIILFASPLLFGQFEDGINWDHVFQVWMNNLPLLGLFLVHRFILMPLFFFKGKKAIYFTVTLALVIMGTFVIYASENRFERPSPPPPENRLERPREKPPGNVYERENGRPPGRPPGQNNRGPIPRYVNFLTLAILLVGFDAGLQISMRWLGMEKDRFKLQKESVENQLAFLRNQVSPHFFMNTLNNIHALVDIDSEQAKQSIVKLSNLMRHLLYDSEDKYVPIKKEVEFVQSYIELMRLRFSDKVKIEVSIPSEIPDKSIPPLLFTALLENAFKHGISYNHQSFVKIEMGFTEKALNFRVENSNHPRKSDEASGIGLENTRKRLDLLYAASYELNISDTEEKFTVFLKLPL